MSPELKVRITAQNQSSAGFAQVVSDANNAAKAVQTSSAAMGRSMQAANLNTAGLAAQFNDIGVTVASGQSPFLIALQQGTQISQVLGPMGAAGAVKALGAAFLSLLSPVNLITIGAITLGAAAVQWLMGLNQEAPKAEEKLKAHREWLSAILAGYKDAEDAAEAYIAQAKKLPQAAIESDLAARQKEQLEEVERGFRSILSVLQDFEGYAGYAKAFGVPDDVAESLRTARDLLRDVTADGKLSGDELDRLTTILTELKNSTADQNIRDIAEAGLAVAQSFRDANAALSGTLAALQQFQQLPDKYFDALGALGEIGRKSPTEREQAALQRDQGLAGANDAITRTAVLKAYNEALARIDTRDAEEEALKRNKEFAADAKRQSDSYQAVIESLQMQTEAVGLSAREQEKLNQVKAAGVAINSAEAQSIRDAVDALYDQREALAAFEEQQKRVQDVMDDLRSISKSFAAQVRTDLADGKSAWEAFANAGLDALDRIAAKALDMAIDGIWDMIFDAVSGINFGSLGNDVGTGATFAGVQDFLKSANGNVFPSGISGYSSQVVSRPTVFPFAKGIGLMGEAGPEAIMPLRRGANGRLGVEAANGNAGVQVVIENHGAEVTGVRQQRGPDGQRQLRMLVRAMVNQDMADGVYSPYGVGPALRRR